MKRVKAGALYYAIFISFFIALISGFMILQQWYGHYYVLYVRQGEQLERDLKSAVLVAMQHPEMFPSGQKKTLDLYDDSIHQVEITRKWWGGYQLIRTDASWRVVRKSRIEMVGLEILPPDLIALYLADEGKYLSLAGKTEIKGNSYLPKLGVRKAYIEGSGYTGNKLIDGEMKESQKSLPPTDQLFLEKNLISAQEKLSAEDSIMDIGYLLKSKTISNSFFQKTLRFSTSRWLVLQDQQLKGNIKILSKAGITVKKSASLQDVILYAPKIEVEEDFAGSLQCFVTDTLLVGKDCTFRYPSLFGLNETKIRKPVIRIGENSTVLGDIVMIARSDTSNISPECIIGKEALINGTVYCAGKVNLQGAIKGQLFCKGFILRTYSSIYENHLMNASINSTLLSPYYAGSLYGESAKPQKPIKCMD